MSHGTVRKTQRHERRALRDPDALGHHGLRDEGNVGVGRRRLEGGKVLRRRHAVEHTDSARFRCLGRRATGVGDAKGEHWGLQKATPIPFLQLQPMTELWLMRRTQLFWFLLPSMCV